MLHRVTDGVLVHQSELLRNNTVVVLGRTGALVIDPGLSGTEMSCLAGDLCAIGHPVTAGFATHPDWDHVLWHADLGDVPRFGTARCAAFLQDLRSDADWKRRVAAGLPPEIADDVPLDLFGLITALPQECTQVPWDGPRVRVIEHPAHAQGHAALFVEERRVLIAGDMLSDLFVPMLDLEDATDPIGDYLVGLGELEAVADDADAVVPGHGAVGDGEQVRARIDRDRAYVLALRDGRTPVGDPRIGAAAQPGWEWVSEIHTGQVASLARKRNQTPGLR